MRRTLIFIVAVLILFQTVGAVSSNLHDSYQPRETAIGKLTGTILQPISAGQVRLMRNNVQISFDYGIQKLGSDYYIWFVAPATVNNYSLIIEDVVTVVNGQTTVQDYRKDFSVIGEVVAYNVRPGIILSSQNFELVSNVYSDENQNIEVSFPSLRQIALNAGQNTVEFSIETIQGTQMISIQFGDYVVPAYLIGSSQNISQNGSSNNNSSENSQNSSQNSTTNSTNQSNQSENSINRTEDGEIKFKFNPELIVSKVLIGETTKYQFTILNDGEREIKNLFFDYDDRVFDISPKEFTISPGRSEEFELQLRNASRNERIREVIIASLEGRSEFMIISVDFTLEEEEAKTDYIENKSGAITGFYCSELNGNSCKSAEICTGNNVLSLDGSCCVGGVCQAAENNSSYSWVGYLIAGIIVLVLVIVYRKYRKTKSDSNPIQKI